jgi:hypothetical protein
MLWNRFPKPPQANMALVQSGKAWQPSGNPFSAPPTTPDFFRLEIFEHHQHSTTNNSTFWSIRHRLSPRNQQNGKPDHQWLSAIQSRLVWPFMASTFSVSAPRNRQRWTMLGQKA